jgi:micrococcal nuclease
VPTNNDRVKARVVRITDGDTIVVTIDGVEHKVRYIGVDSPEPGAYGGNLSSYINSQLVLGKTVTLVKDVSETDKYDRLLRYVFVGDTFVNYEMVRSGYATAGSWPPDTSCDSAFLTAFATAKSNKVGLWKPTATPVPYVPPVPLIIQPSKAPGGNCDPAYPTVCIPSPPPDLDCGQIPFRRFQVLPPDPHNFDGDHDGIGCES